MKSFVLRLVLVVAAVAAVAGSGYYVFTEEGRAAGLREGQRAFDESAARLQVTLADLRASQAAYLAPDQDRGVWSSRSAALCRQADAQVKRLSAAASVPDAISEMSTAAESVAALGRFDARIRELLDDNQPLSASSLIFSDSVQLSLTASNALGMARGAVARAAGSEISRGRQLELYAIAGAAGVVVLVLVVLVPTGRARRAQESESTLTGARGEAIVEPAREVTLEGLDLAPRPRRSEPLAAMGVPARRTLEPPAAAPTAPPAATVPTAAGASHTLTPAGAPDSRLDLLEAARLCTDLARVKDTTELQALLARAASVLDASGIVVWIAGNEGNLWPVFSHGYGAQALSKMQSLPRDAGTAVSVAFRKAALEVVPAENENSGAIVAPILTSTGCVGVMAVEIPPGTETSAGEQALAAIIAAQLATLVPSETNA